MFDWYFAMITAMKSNNELIALIQSIVTQSMALKNKHTKEPDALVNYCAIFSQNQTEYNSNIASAKQIGEVIQDTLTGSLFHITPVKTPAGYLHLLKIRKPDPTRPEKGDADFTIRNYPAFKEQYLGQPGFKLIRRENFEMIELMDPNFPVRAYFSNPPLDQQLGLERLAA